jgi:hypothetical protein
MRKALQRSRNHGAPNAWMVSPRAFVRSFGLVNHIAGFEIANEDADFLRVA